MALNPTSSRGGAGSVTSVTAGDTSIVVGGTAAAPSIATGTLDAIAAAHPAAADVTLNAHKLTNVTDPASAQDAATKAYVDAVALGLTFKSPADLGTITTLPANVYANGASGVGATLTATAFGALSVDGTAVAAGQRILVKTEAATANNGIYTVTVAGGVATLYVLTRATDYNQTSEIQAGDALFVTAGGTLADTVWVQTTTGAITVGTTAIAFSQFGAPAPVGNALAAIGLKAATSTPNVSLGTTTPGGGDLVRLMLLEQVPAGVITGAAIGLEVIGAAPSGTCQLGLATFAPGGEVATYVAVTADIAASLTTGLAGIRRIPFTFPYTADGTTPLWVALAFSANWGTNVQVSGIATDAGIASALTGFFRARYASVTAGAGTLTLNGTHSTWSANTGIVIWGGVY